MDVPLQCSCGAVQGVALDVTPDNGNRVVCCCDDCQSFAEHLGVADSVLDEFGGTDLFQTSPSQVRINTGMEHLRCLRLTSRGPYRWYAGCCQSPIGNTMTASIPFVGLMHSFIRPEGSHDEALGPVRFWMQTKHARGNPTYPEASKGFPVGVMLRMGRKLLVWKLRGKGKPSAFFDADGKPHVEPVRVS